PHHRAVRWDRRRTARLRRSRTPPRFPVNHSCRRTRQRPKALIYRSLSTRLRLPASLDPFPWTAESAKKLVADKDEDAERLKQIDRFKQRRRRRRRMWVWLGTVSGGVASGFLAEDFIRTHLPAP